MEWPSEPSNLSSVATQPRMWQHVILLVTIVAAVTVVYAKVTGAYFCAYDDFDNLHQTVFQDTYQPMRILTTSHFNSYKYRPMQRLANLFTNFLGNGDPTVFRIRNLSFHLVNVMLVYALGWQLFRSARVSGAAALLFGLHPLANQSVIGAIWTNTLAHAGFLLALVMFIASTRAKRFWSLWLIGALISASLSLLTYDSEIVVFGLMLAYLLLFVVWREHAVRLPYIALFVTVSSVFLGLYFLLRQRFVPSGWEQVTTVVPSPATVSKNVVMYLTALVNPVDFVLANDWFGIPLPSEITLNESILIPVGVFGLFVVSSIGIYAMRRLIADTLASQKVDWAAALLLVFGIGAPLLPVLVFSSHPSETYLYLPVAFYALLLVYLLAKLLRQTCRPTGYALYVPITFLVVVFSAATWVRNQRVSDCGETVHKILYGLPDNVLRDGSRTLAFANVPGEKATRPYGFYGFRGIDTIADSRVADADGAITRALQLVYRNKALTGKVVSAEELPSICSAKSTSRNICVWVHWDGKIDTCCHSSALAPVLCE
jgi:hypothetical protein